LIEQCLREGERQEKSWDCFFQRTGVSPFRVEYEKLYEDYETTIRDVLDFLKISLPRRVRIGTPVTIKQSDEISHAWEERFLKTHYAALAQS
jgi:LPS sulfotransferase NodH